MGLGKVLFNRSKLYIQDSAIAGLSHAAKAHSRSWAVYWVIIFLVGLGLTTYGIVKTTYDVVDMPVLSTTELKYESSVEFPAVTICNHNRQQTDTINPHKIIKEVY